MPPFDLPVAPVLPELVAALERDRRAVLVAPPGAGKTTLVPLTLMQQQWVQGRILMLEPRRVATRAAARRMSALLEEEPGKRVGWTTRFERVGSLQTRVEVVTEGIFTRRIQADPTLEGVAVIIFDEFHERSLDADLGLALAIEAQQALRPDLAILVMSATLAASTVSALLDDAPVIRSEGRSFPVTRHYLPSPKDLPLPAQIASALQTALAIDGGDILCFLPGTAEIRRTRMALESDPAYRELAIVPLYGDLPPAQQDRALQGDSEGRRKIILATDIAETSLTIDGVSIVIDAGLARKPAFSPRTGMSRLETIEVSQAATEQRAGRAGRQRPGHCFRLWAEGAQRLRPAHDTPEMERADLAPLALELAAWGVRGPDALRWLTAPPTATWGRAISTLRSLGALAEDGGITPHGSRIRALPLHPRLAHMIVRAEEHGLVGTAVALAALLSARDPWRQSQDPDLGHRLELWQQGGGNADKGALRELQRVAGQIARLAGPAQPIEPQRAGEALALAYPERVGQGRGKSGSFRLANGRGARFAMGTPMAAAPWIVAADLDDGGAEARIHLAAEIASDRLQRLCADAIRVEDEVAFAADTGRIEATRTTRLGTIVLLQQPLLDVAPEAITEALLQHLRDEGLEVLPWTNGARSLLARLRFAARMEKGRWPATDDEALMASLDTWLAPYLAGRRNFLNIDMEAALGGLLSWEQRQALDRLAPAAWQTPGGRQLRIDYEGPQPVIATRLQDLLGVDSHPSVAGVPLSVHLLSPAQRPIQVTSDLPRFWRGSYAKIRKDLRGRYPKHDWPEDPLASVRDR
ncbi:ATP-dependent helicase HrpB [Arboricoccus pini]|uniref:ATP-dependent helicase HrpB n=1 Tax=Arboricoccus pini TaxID=1963835 RepID=A0A212QPS2_9PROT|nr:ATP-dependent helicase HrpB [Arboricoccus pini]SNB61284.1 ATP-dependent helicase HrpB [Arboricoccus pini]